MKNAFPMLLVFLFSAACGGPPKPPCGPSTCAGCCDASGSCNTFTSATACGLNGLICKACTAGQSCNFGTCSFASNSGGGTGTGGGGGATGGGGGVTGGGAGGGTPTTNLRLFVTSFGTNANLGGLAGADARCTAFANAAALGGTWRAFVSSSTVGGITASSRLVANGPWYQEPQAGAPLLTFNNKANLSTAPLVAISTDESGGGVIGSQLVWTGTTTAGAIGSACTTWTAGDTTGTVGTFGRVGTGAPAAEWTGFSTQDCNLRARLLCFEESRLPAPPASGPTKRMFVTAIGTTGALGGTSGADARCALVAQAAGKSGTWKAFAGSSTAGGITAASRIAGNGPWYQERTGGMALTFRNKANLSTVPVTTIDTNENGANIAAVTRVWTGTNLGGNIGSACMTWSATAGTIGTYGEIGSSAVRANWTGVATQDCSTSASLICLED